MANQIPSDKYKFQNYKEEDKDLIPIVDIDSSLTGSSFIEFNIYDLNDRLLYHTPNYSKYSVLDDSPSSGEGISQFNIDPDLDVKTQGYDSGNYVAYYSFVTNQIGTPFQKLYIEEISSDRTEIRLNSTALDSFEIENQTEDFIDFREENIYFTDFLLNFGNNQQIIANNIKLDDEDPNNPTILVKLYEELPPIFEEKSQLYIVTSYSSPEAFSVVYAPTITDFNDSIPLEGPNFNLPIKNEVNNSSENLSADDILLGSTTTLSNQIQGLLSQSAINISIDYTDYNDFIHFSSAETRLENFYYKVSLLEQYSESISSLNNTTGSSTSVQLFENKISSIITNFDGYDKFLYYETGSTSWPKTSLTKPYTLAKTGSAEVITWYGISNPNSLDFGGQIASASLFDLDNPDYLYDTIPDYLREDPENQPYDLFIDMLAQYYDNVWLYTKDISQKYNTDNRLDFGVSKDLVSDAIKDFGLKLYQNNFSNSDLYTAFLGITPSGSLFPFPEITGSMPVPTGFEFVDTLISASNDVISMDDTNKSLYKRIYHNIPYLLNKKGTTTGLRALITSYGIPDSILKISEFGGKDKVNANDYDLYSNHFNYAFKADGFNSMYTEWTVNPEWSSPLNQPNSVQFRFKTQNITSGISPFGLSNLQQTLWRVQNTAATNQNLELVLEYTGSGLDSGSLVNDSGSYEGSIPNPEYKFAKLTFYPDTSDTNTTASVYLPFVDGEWWSVMVQKNGSNYDLYAGNKIYNGDTGTKIGFYASSSVITGSDQAWTTQASSGATQFYGTAQFGISTYGGNGGGGGGGAAPAAQTPTLWGALEWGNDNWGYNEAPSGFGTSYFGSGGPIGNSLSGSLQEVRYFNIAISESVFKDYIMNPLSFESNGVNTAPNNLIFRGALGSELDLLSSSSIHPLTTGSWVARNSFQDTNTSSFSSTPIYEPNTEYIFQDQPAVGIKNRITDKVRWENNVLPGDTLSPYRKIAQTTEASASYSENINYLEVAFSPQNQINDDIIGQMGHFNIGDYIGDPRDRSSKSVIYPSLNSLSEDYFKKYIKQYDLTDFVRLIKFFDNSLFKMIKDFIPARTSLASGLVVKQHLLERNKYPQPQVSYSDESELLGSIDMVKIEGGSAGMFNEFNSTTTSPSGSLQQGPNNPFNITQSWDVTTPSLYGEVTKTHDSQTEFYDGELSGSVMLITDGELNEDNPFKLQSSIPASYKVRVYSSTVVSEGVFLQYENNPTPGYISLFLDLNGGGYVKFIKVAQKDENGNDFSVSLGSLNSISIPWSIGTQNYPILSSVDRTTYNTLTTSNTLGTIYNADITQIDYSTSGSMDGSTTGTNSNFSAIKNFNLPIPTVISDPTSFIVNNTYTVNTIPQKDITVDFSGTIQITNFNILTPIYLRLFKVPFGESLTNLNNPLVNVNIPADFTNFNYPPVNYNISHTFSYTSFQSELEPGDQVALAFSVGTPITGSISPTTAVLTNSQMEVTSTPSTGPTLPTVINPYLPSLFQNSEYDILINNADKYSPNPFLQDLDYSTNALVPINIDRVISGSAEKGTVPELYYTSLKQILPRYLGSKNQTTGFNLYNPDVPSSPYFPQVGIKAPYDDITETNQTSSTLHDPGTPYAAYPPSCIFPGLTTTTIQPDGLFEPVVETAVDNLGNDQPINLIKVNIGKLQDLVKNNPGFEVSLSIKGVIEGIQTPYQALQIGYTTIALINGKVEKAQTYWANQNSYSQISSPEAILWTSTNNFTFNVFQSINIESLLTKVSNGREYISVALYHNASSNPSPSIGDFYLTDLEPVIQINYDSKQNIGTYGQTPSVDILDTNIYEFEWGNSGYPELIDGGNLKTGNILQVSSPELVQLADPNMGIKTIQVLEPLEGLRKGSAEIYNRTIGNDGTPANLINTPPINQFYTAFTSSIGIRGQSGNDVKEFWINTLETNQYKQTLDTGLYAGNQVKLTMYPNENAGANPETPKTTTILSTEWGMPKESSYAITSSFYESNTNGSITTTAAGFIQSSTPYIYLFRFDILNNIKKNEDGFYEPTDTIRPTFLSFNNQINSDINEGKRWFITFYNEFEYPNTEGNYDAPLATGSLSPYNFGFTDQEENGDYIYPLANKGIYEVLGTRDLFNGYNQILTNHNWVEDRLIGGNGVTTDILSAPSIGGPSQYPPPASISGDSGSLGMLMWKAESYHKSEYIVVGNKVGGLVNAGAIIPKNTAKYVDDNFEAITKQYGANKT